MSLPCPMRSNQVIVMSDQITLHHPVLSMLSLCLVGQNKYCGAFHPRVIEELDPKCMQKFLNVACINNLLHVCHDCGT